MGRISFYCNFTHTKQIIYDTHRLIMASQYFARCSLSELCEEWALANSRECVEGGSAGTTHGEESEDTSEARFTLKYLGSTLVETPSSEEATAEAIKTVITMVRIRNLFMIYLPSFSNVF